MPKAAFLDRDGIINMDTGYVHKIEDFIFVPGIFALCAALLKKDFLIIITTNQSGIGRGLFTLDDFHRLNQWMVEQFKTRNIPVHKVYFCPHHPTAGMGAYKIACSCRKPAPGMLLKARKECDIDLNNSLLIGDKVTDIKAGIAAGIPNNFLIRPASDETKDLADCMCFANLAELAAYI